MSARGRVESWEVPLGLLRQTARVLRDNLARFRELLRSRHVPKVRQVLRKLLGDGEVLWFEPQEGGGYELTGDTRLGSLFNSSGAQERT